MKRLLSLTDEARGQLAHRYKTEKNARFRERLHCVLLKEQGYTNTQIAQMLLVCFDTITKWLDTYQDGGIEALCRLEAGGSQGWLTSEQITVLTAELDKNRFQSAKQVCAWVEAQFGLCYSERGMRALLKRLGYTPQKAYLVPAQADPEAQALFFGDLPTGEDPAP